MLSIFLLLSLFGFVQSGIPDNVKEINAKCRDLLSCSIKKHCVQMSYLVKQFDKAEISESMYNDLDKVSRNLYVNCRILQ